MKGNNKMSTKNNHKIISEITRNAFELNILLKKIELKISDKINDDVEIFSPTTEILLELLRKTVDAVKSSIEQDINSLEKETI